MPLDKPTATSSAAGITTTQGVSPMEFSDKCFLCGNMIGESDPRSFYQGTRAMMLCHRGCLNIMDAHGGTPADYHRAIDNPVTVVEPEVPYVGPSWLDFADLAALADHVRSKGSIPDHVKVTIAGQVVQAGS